MEELPRMEHMLVMPLNNQLTSGAKYFTQVSFSFLKVWRLCNIFYVS